MKVHSFINNFSGFHQAVIHMNLNVLTRLLELVERYPQLNSCINDQNSLYQVRKTINNLQSTCKHSEV